LPLSVAMRLPSSIHSHWAHMLPRAASGGKRQASVYTAPRFPGRAAK
jgi:hypothetical protein